MEEEGWIKSHYCVCGCVYVCVLCAIPGTALLFTLAKQTREFHLETRRAPGKHRCRVSASPPPAAAAAASRTIQPTFFFVPSVFFPAVAALLALFAIVPSLFFLSRTPLRCTASFRHSLPLLVGRSAWASDKLTGGDFRRTLHLCINSSG